jgi:ABC-2 type transport system permease protein
MLRSVLWKTLRDQRYAAPVWGLCLGLVLVAVAAGWARAYPDAASRALLAREVEGTLAVAQVFYGKPSHIDRLGGFVEWRGLGLFPVLLGLFAVLATTGTTRGAEARGELEVVLVAAGGRGRLFAEQSGGLLLALAVVGALVWAALLLCGPAAGEAALSPVRSALAVVNVCLGAACFGAVALLAAQLLPSRRVAALAGGIALVAAYVWNNLALVVTALGPARPLSPLYLVSRSTPLADGRVDPWAMAALALLTAAVAAAAGGLFVRRDLGATAALPVPRRMRAAVGVWARRTSRGGSQRLLSGPYARGVRDALGPTLAWGAALGAYALLIAALTPMASASFARQVRLQAFLGELGRGDFGADSGFLSLGLFTFLPALVALFAVTLAASLAAEEREGQLELELTAPVPRWRYFVLRAGAAWTAVGLVLLLPGGLFLVVTGLAGLHVDGARAVAAVLVLVPLGWAVAGFGYMTAAARPRAVAAMAGAVVAASYALDLLAPLWRLPDAVRDLSLFRLAGQPLTEGVRWGGPATLAALGVLFVLAGAVAFSRRDIVR